MTDDETIRLAFAGPEARAAALDPGLPPRDRLSLRDHVVAADIGAFQPERGQTQRLRFNVVVEIRPHPAPLDDDVDRILSYDRITEAIAAELASDRLNLLETLAEGVASRLLALPQPMRVFVRVEKLDRGPGALGIEIVRDRAGAEALDAEAALPPAPRPVMVFLDGAGLADPALADWLAGLSAPGTPQVIALGAPGLARPASTNPDHQRRIDLLAIEQNAWSLATRLPATTVVATRTELDWALRQGRRVIWAPGKLVTDSPAAPASADGLALALWLAEMLNAERLVVHGDVAVPAKTRVPVTRA